MDTQSRSERFEVVNEIFADAFELQGEERARLLEARCAGDSALRDSVMLLLNQLECMAGFLDKPAVQRTETVRLEPGQLLAERFLILERVGMGGMGEVFRVDDQLSGETVALKTIRPELRDNPEVMARFRQEIRLARKVSSPAICRIFELFRSREGGGDLEFFTMQYLEGTTLAERIAAGPFAAQEALAVFTQIADGLEAAHKAGIIHRDLKPSNVILVPAPNGGTSAVITDFGLARLLDAGGPTGVHTVAGQILGSPDYMAPEQFEAVPLTPAADIFAAGVILFEMLAGKKPYPSEDILRAAVRRVTATPPAISSVTTGLPRHWDQVLAKALARSPEDRYQSVAEMKLDLEGHGTKDGLKLPSRRILIRGGISAVLLSSLYGVSRYIKWTPAIPQSPLIMLTPLTHSADDAMEAAALDWTLSSQLAQSAHVGILAKDKIQSTWQRMQGKPDKQLPALTDSKLARQIAMRNFANAAVFGSFSKAGDQRTLTLQLELMGSSPEHPAGKPFLKHFDASRAADLPSTGREAAVWIRETLGENAKSLSERNRAPEELTTPSWPAFQEYVAGNEAGMAKPDEAVLHLKTALQLDPDFALAAGRLGDILMANGKRDEALGYWSKAAENLQKRNLTDRESLRIRGLFAADAGLHEEAEQIFARWAMEYPGDPLPVFYRARSLDQLGHAEAAERCLKEVLRSDPQYVYRMTYAIFCLGHGRLKEAETIWKKLLGLESDAITAQTGMALALTLGDMQAMRDWLTKLRNSGVIGTSKSFVYQAFLDADQGRLTGAEEALLEGVQFDLQANSTLAASTTKRLQLARLLVAQQRSKAVELANAALKTEVSPSVRLAFGAVLAQAGESKLARKCLLADLPDWPIYKTGTDLLQVELAFAIGDFTSAMNFFQTVRAFQSKRVCPEPLLRAAVSARNSELTNGILNEAATQLGLYWLGDDYNVPGFVRRLVTAARTISHSGKFAAQQRILTPILGEI